MEEIKAYKPCCCSKAYMTKQGAKKHEASCFNNKANRACITCKNCSEEYDTVYVPPRGDENSGDADYDLKYYYCEHYQRELISKLCPEEKGIYYRRDCEYWEDKDKPHE